MAAKARRLCIYFFLLKEVNFQRMYIHVLIFDTVKVLVLDAARVLKPASCGLRLCLDMKAVNAC